VLSFRVRGKFVSFIGIKCDPISHVEKLFVDINRTAKEYNILIIALNAIHILNWRVLLKAVEHAIRAFERGVNISRKIPIEVMLYLSGKRQINEALSIFGLKPNITEIVVVLISEEVISEELINTIIKLFPNARISDNLLFPSQEKLQAIQELYDIREEELNASVIKGNELLEELIEKIILSRIALFECKK